MNELEDLVGRRPILEATLAKIKECRMFLNGNSGNGPGGLNRNSTYVMMVTLNANVYVGIVHDALSAKFTIDEIKAQKILAKITPTAQS